MGERLRVLRISKGWSQAELATRMAGRDERWTQSTVAKTEAATRPIRLNELAALAETFNVPLAELVGSASDTSLGEEGHLRALILEDATLRARRREVQRQIEALDHELEVIEDELDRVGHEVHEAVRSRRTSHD